ncbi:uncharacterized protein BCR38DRAFT_443755 [Pseudomassariella vexata]|uniref:Secreted protein n=1 Tax=Pseudomassariella vexata TaxID=1141098 RepID=A0A1Y2DLN2_9PEZI|nr:uncharacterized protein BCR38DRAFT_443755 [Pseudomassariella vexata]ORY60046.1 hypothetical protein BCR38DRAFT_443755 [Pseudomassariella vexata]
MSSLHLFAFCWPFLAWMMSASWNSIPDPGLVQCRLSGLRNCPAEPVTGVGRPVLLSHNWLALCTDPATANCCDASSIIPASLPPTL